MKVAKGVVIAALVVGCGSDEGAASMESNESATGSSGRDPSSGNPQSDSSSGSATSSVDSSGTTEPFEPFEPVPARAIRPVALEGNQGIGIELAREGEVVPATSPLLTDRRTLLQAQWELDGDWIARDIEARLQIVGPDGTESIHRHVLRIDGPPGPGSLDPRFEWIVEPEELVEGAEYSVSLWEVEPGFETLPEPAASPSLPSDGRALLPILGGDLRLEVVLVPMNYDVAGCSSSVDLSEETLQFLLDTVVMRLPINGLDVSVHAPLTVSSPLTQGIQVLDRVGGLRAAENPGPNVFYMGFINTCGDLLLGGQSWIPAIPPTPNEAALRVSWVHWEPHDLAFTASSTVHELTHALGRQHIRCTGTEDDIDTDYPVSGGGLGERAGWGVIDLAFRDPAIHADYMSYCRPTWISGYGWNLVVPVLATLTEWGAGDVGMDVVPSALVGVRTSDSSVQRWTRTRVQLPVADLAVGEAVDLVSAEGKRTPGEVYVRAVADGDGELVVVPLPESNLRPSRLVHRKEGRERVHILE